MCRVRTISPATRPSAAVCQRLGCAHHRSVSSTSAHTNANENAWLKVPSYTA